MSTSLYIVHNQLRLGPLYSTAAEEFHDRAAGFEAFMMRLGGAAVLFAAGALGKPPTYFGRRSLRFQMLFEGNFGAADDGAAAAKSNIF